MKDTILIEGEIPFQITKKAFCIGETASGYTLYSSIDCVNSEGKTSSGANATWAAYTDTAIPANKQLDVVDAVPGRWYKLVGNTGNVVARL